MCYNNNGDDMNKNIDKNNLNDVISISKKILKLFYTLLIVIGAYVLLRIVKELGLFSFLITIIKVLSPLFIGIVVAWLLKPFVKWLEDKKVRRGLGTSLAYVILIGAIILLVKAIIPLLYNQTIDLVGNFPDIFNTVKNWIEGIFSNVNSSAVNIENFQNNLMVRLDEISVNLSTTLPSLIINSATTVVTYIGTFLIGLVIGFYLLLNKYIIRCIEENINYDMKAFGDNRESQERTILYANINDISKKISILDSILEEEPSLIKFLPEGIRNMWPEVCVTVAERDPYFVCYVPEEVVKNNLKILEKVSDDDWRWVWLECAQWRC